MKKHSDELDWENKRSSIIGLGEKSIRKSYYPELQNRISELEKFKVLIENISDSIFILELPNGIINEVNISATRLLGKGKKVLLNKSIFKFLNHNKAQELKNGLI